MVTNDPVVSVKLSDIQRIRDQLMRLREESPQIKRMFSQVAGLYQRCKAQPQTRAGEAQRKKETITP